MTDQPDKLGSTAAEASFFGIQHESETLDQELIDLAPGPNPLFPFILILLAAFSGFLLYQYWAEAMYYFQSSEPVVLGSVLDWERDRTSLEGTVESLPQNRVAQLRGVTQRRAIIGRDGYAKLAGVPIFAELDPTLLDEQSRTATTYGEMLEYGGERYVVSKPGRLVPFSKLPVRYKTIARYLSRAFELQLCDVDLDADIRQALQSERERNVLLLAEDLGHTPTEPEIQQHLGAACGVAWLYQEGVMPKDHRNYMIMWLLAWAILIGSCGFLAVWLQRFQKFHAK